jgi:hypothetical protein
MSALQTFLLVVDHDKEEAKRIADSVAQGKSPQMHPAFAHPHCTDLMTLTEAVSYRPRKQEDYPDRNCAATR